MYLGLDIAIRHTGIVVLRDDGTLAYHYTVKTNSGDSFSTVFKTYKGALDFIFKTHSIDSVLIEGYSFGAIWNLGTITKNAELTGFLIWQLIRHKVPRFYIVSPSQLKKFISGKGNTKKNMIPKIAYKKYSIDFDSDDEIDAFGLAKMGYMIENEMPNVTGYEAEVLKKIKGVKL
jgi:crossover junction endodeoxyribonuclease RuvC